MPVNLLVAVRVHQVNPGFYDSLQPERMTIRVKAEYFLLNPDGSLENKAEIESESPSNWVSVDVAYADTAETIRTKLLVAIQTKHPLAVVPLFILDSKGII